VKACRMDRLDAILLPIFRRVCCVEILWSTRSLSLWMAVVLPAPCYRRRRCLFLPSEFKKGVTHIYAQIVYNQTANISPYLLLSSIFGSQMVKIFMNMANIYIICFCLPFNSGGDQIVKILIKFANI
jgi:hypothetical protein